MKKNDKLFLRIAVSYCYFLILQIVCTYITTQITVKGTDMIAKSADKLTLGELVDYKTLFISFFIMIIIGLITGFGSNYFGGIFSAKILQRFKNTTVKKILRLEYKYFDDKGSGSVITKITSDIAELQSLFGWLVPEFISSLILFLTVAVYMFIQSWQLLILTLILYPFILFITNFIAKKLIVLAKARRNTIDEMTAIAYDMVGGMPIERSYNLKDIMYKRVEKSIDTVLDNEVKRQKLSAISSSIQTFLSWIPGVALSFIAAIFTIKKLISTGDLLAYSFLLRFITRPMSSMPFIINEIREKNVSIKRLEEIIAQPDEISGLLTEPSDLQVPISFKDISFEYNNENKVLSDINFEIKANTTAAFVGSSGGGKTTLFKLICGFYHPSSGEYKMFGNKIEDWDINCARDNISLVTQDVFMFPESIAANVAYGKPNSTFDEVVEACKMANIHDFIEGLPNKYDTLVGERGIKLSGGERQRISIARAFLKNAPILMLDEPTSSLDIENEKLIQQAIDRISANKTVIVIAHRLSTIENADEIFVINKGTIAERGTHSQLITNNGVYSTLYGKQALEGEAIAI